MITAEACAILYYIFVYIQFVLLTPLIEKLAKSKCWNMGFAIAPVAIILFLYIPSCTGYELNHIVAIIWNDSCLPWFSFYYLGILLRNGCLDTEKIQPRKCVILYLIFLLMQIAEGYMWMKIDSAYIATQLKLSSIFASMIICLLVCRYILKAQGKETIQRKTGFLYIEDVFAKIGDNSFGIYLSHILVMRAAHKLFPFYAGAPYVGKSVFILFVSWGCVVLGKRILGKYGKWIGLI